MAFLSESSNVSEFEVVENALGKEDGVPTEKLNGFLQRRFKEFRKRTPALALALALAPGQGKFHHLYAHILISDSIHIVTVEEKDPGCDYGGMSRVMLSNGRSCWMCADCCKAVSEHPKVSHQGPNTVRTRSLARTGIPTLTTVRTLAHRRATTRSVKSWARRFRPNPRGP